MRENNKMQRGAFFCLWILFTFSLFAQNKENGSVACDSIVYKNTFRKALKKFLNFSDFDTTYISPNRYNYALMLDHFTNYEYYSVGNNDQRLRFSPNPHNKIGAYFGWRWIFLGWAVDTDWLYGKKSKKKRGTDLTSAFTVPNWESTFSIAAPETTIRYTRYPAFPTRFPPIIPKISTD